MLVFEMTQSPLQLPNLRWKHQTSRLTDASQGVINIREMHSPNSIIHDVIFEKFIKNKNISSCRQNLQNLPSAPVVDNCCSSVK